MRRIMLIAGSFLAGIVLTIAVVLFIPGMRAADDANPEPQPVARIRVELQKYVDAQVEGSRLNFPKRPSWFGTPDYYLEVRLRDSDDVITTETFDDTPVGNGLEWILESPIELADVYEVRLYDAGVFSDTLVDRVLIADRYEEGQYFNFRLER